jgi:hypothetical protein
MKPETAVNLPVSKFFSHLVLLNRLERLDFDRFVFFPGMLFLTFDTWWSGSGMRKTAHEGLDICFFVNSRQERYRLDESVNVPVMYEGRIVHVMDDFLGQTLVVQHILEGLDKGPLLVFYAHIRPDPRLQIGDVIESGTAIGTIADASRISSPLMSHLHLSLAWEFLLPPVDTLSWEILNQVNRSVYIDPLLLLSEPHILWEYPTDFEFNSFVKCSITLNS